MLIKRRIANIAPKIKNKENLKRFFLKIPIKKMIIKEVIEWYKPKKEIGKINKKDNQDFLESSNKKKSNKRFKTKAKECLLTEENRYMKIGDTNKITEERKE